MGLISWVRVLNRTEPSTAYVSIASLSLLSVAVHGCISTVPST